MIEALRGMVCQKVCAASQFSLVLTAGGKVQLILFIRTYLDRPIVHAYLAEPLCVQRCNTAQWITVIHWYPHLLIFTCIVVT